MLEVLGRTIAGFAIFSSFPVSFLCPLFRLTLVFVFSVVLSQEYVALTTAAYRQAIDQAWDDTVTSWEETSAAQLLAEPQTARTALAQLFARGQDFIGQRLDF